jgi:hypothetical protein
MEKVHPFQPTEVRWDLFQKRPGMVKQMMPLETFLDDLQERPRYYAQNFTRFVEREARAEQDQGAKQRWLDILEALNGDDDQLIAFFTSHVSEVDTGLKQLTNAELRDKLEARGLPVYGAKDVLVSRLQEAI